MSGWWKREFGVSPEVYLLICLWSMVLAAAIFVGSAWLVWLIVGWAK